MNEEDIRPYILTKKFGKKIFAFDVLDSTNIKAKSLALDNVPEGAVVIAEHQIAGKGRLGRIWISETGKNLTFSVIIRPQISLQHLGILSLYAGVSVARAITKVTDKTVQCKWPNDVLLNGKKVCGILSESVTTNHSLTAVIIGIGININQRNFSSELYGKATSLAIETGKEFDRWTILAAVLKEMETDYGNIREGTFDTILRQWTEYSSFIGQPVSVDRQGTIVHGIASHVADDGGLVIRTNGKELKILAGDVTITS
ncbi:MAG TPA: biotin--[acetyl-CoA-carboxylase] ligase [Bacteroidota bacterium]|nr:biotin--[acetyl-CoA-carboxylase] ligase [Bacteroidota bacterium]